MVFSSTLRTSLLLLPLLLLSLPAAAQIAFESKSNGIDRVLVRAMVLDSEGALLAGTPDGLFRRSASDGTWKKLSLSNEVYALQRLPSGTLLAGTTRGIYRSEDEGETWTSVFNVPGVGDFGVTDDGKIIAVDRDANNTRDSFFYTSDDDGRTWKTSRLGFSVLFDTKVTALGSLLFSGSINGVKLSYNGGSIWETTRLQDTVLGVLATESGTLIAWAGNQSLIWRIYESQDSGSSWILVDTIPGIYGVEPGAGEEYYVIASAVLPEGSAEGFGVWRRRVGSSEREHLFEQNGSTALLHANQNLWAAANYRVYSSSESAPEWEEISTGVTSVPIEKVATAPDGLVYALVPDSIRFIRHRFSSRDLEFHTTYALFRSENDAENWESVASGLDAMTLEVDPFGNVYAGVDSLDMRTTLEGEIVLVAKLFTTRVSTDRGESWFDFGAGTIRDLSGGGEGVLALAMLDSTGRYPQPDLTISLDSGRSWQRMSDPGMPWEDTAARRNTRSSEVAADGTILLSIGGDSSGIYRVSSTGESFAVTRVTNGVAPPDIERLESGRLIAGSDVSGDGLRTSTDNGMTWSLWSPGTNFSTLHTLGRDYLWGNQRFYSNDAGETWVAGPSLREVVLAPNGILYGTTGFSYQRSLSGGTLWLDDPFVDPPNSSALAASTTGYLYIGANGIYRSVSPVASVEVEGDLRLPPALDLTLLRW